MDGAGSGIAPLVGLLEDLDGSGPAVVILRARRRAGIPHLDGILELASRLPATVHVLEGARGQGLPPQSVHVEEFAW